MKKIILITLILLIKPISTFGSPIGKGFICKKISKDKIFPSSYSGFWILNEKGFEWWAADILDLDKDDDQYEYNIIFDQNETHHLLTEEDLFLSVKSTFEKSLNTKMLIKINRYSLILNQFVETKLVGRSQCELYGNKNQFIERLKNISNSFKNLNVNKSINRKF